MPLLALADQSRSLRQRAPKREEVSRDHGERGAELLMLAAAPELGLPPSAEELALLRKGDWRKAMLAALIRKRTGASTGWIAGRLGMGHPGSVSRLVGMIRDNTKQSRELEDLEKMLLSGD
jgi:hypothetical protein